MPSGAKGMRSLSRLIRLGPDGAVTQLPVLSLWQELSLDKPPSGAASAPAEPGPDCRQLLQAAQERGYERGREDGFAAGVAAGREQVAAELLADWSAQVDKLFGQLQAFIDEQRAYRTQLELSLVDLVMAVAAKLVGQVREQDPSTVLALIRKTATASGGFGHPVNVRVHPQSRPALEEAAAGDGLGGLQFVADQSLHPGDALVETPHGSYDLRIATLLERMRQRLHQELGLS